MEQIIPRDLIRHLEWTPGRYPHVQSKPGGLSNLSGSVKVQTDFSKYVKVGINGIHGSPVVISPFELMGYNNKTYTNSHRSLLSNGMYLPTPKIFTTHVNNVIEAFNGRRKLVYADGEEVSNDVVEDMYKHYTTNFKDIYGTGFAGAWTWLNAKFVSGSGFHGLDLETVVGIVEGKTKLKTVRVPLEECFWEDGFADLSFNSQGLATAESAIKNYSQGKNLYFWHPRKDTVAGFIAGSIRANLDCVRNPDYRNPSLGDFGCAEGAVQKISGGSK